MTEILLCEALKDKVIEAIKDIKLQNPVGDLVTPEVLNGLLPPNNRSESDYPCVVIRLEESLAELETTEVVVRISICTYDECLDENGQELRPVKGYEDGLNVASRIRLALQTLSGGVLSRRYALRFPIALQNSASDDYPYWQVDLVTRWLLRNPVPVCDFTGGFNGIK